MISLLQNRKTVIFIITFSITFLVLSNIVLKVNNLIFNFILFIIIAITSIIINRELMMLIIKKLENKIKNIN